MNDIILCCTSNGKSKYIKYLKCLLQSIKINTPDLKVHVRLVNCDKKTHTEIKKYKNIILQKDEFNKKNKIHVSSLGPHLNKSVLYLLSKYRNEIWGLYDTEAFYTCMVKYNTISNLLNDYRTVIYVDVDTVVRKNILEHINEIKKGDIGLVFDKNETNFPHPGLIIANKSKKMINLMKYMDDHFSGCIKKGDVKAELGDGDLLFKAIKENNINYSRLPSKWKDEGYNFNNNSLMWSGRSERKTKNEIYINEYKKYSI
tara:strand:+ start:3012 stop:3785 length:774 start_codon:yes stop_codon:yes gene_type:complete